MARNSSLIPFAGSEHVQRGATIGEAIACLSLQRIAARVMNLRAMRLKSVQNEKIMADLLT
jgi:hypothetical protein